MKRDCVELCATQRLIELLSSIDHTISYKLVELIRYRQSTVISFLDFGDTNDTIDFTHGTKVYELMNEFGEDYKFKSWEQKRSSIKIGKAIKLIFGDVFPINQPKDIKTPKPPIDIESFVNMFKSERDKNKNYEKFEIVKGRDIRYWYNQANYSRFIHSETTLGRSCLRYEEAGKFLEMYVYNPDVINMLILKDDVDRLRGRAILWHLSEPEGRIYMERIYTINDYDVELYKRFAREQGWLFKSRQTYGYNHNIIDGRTNEEFNWEHFTMKVKLKERKYKYYPYVDTMSVFNPETNVLSNEHKLLRKPPYIRLTDPQGHFIDDADHREMVHSNTYNDDIPREESVFVEFDNDWIYSHDAVYVHNTGGKKAYKRNPLICYSNIMGNEKYFLKESCTWSEYMKTYIFTESMREAYLDAEKTQKILIHRRMINKYFDVKKNGDIIKKPESKKGKNVGIYDELIQKSSMRSTSMRQEMSDRSQDWTSPVDDTDMEEPAIRPQRRPSGYTFGSRGWVEETSILRGVVEEPQDIIVGREEPSEEGPRNRIEDVPRVAVPYRVEAVRRRTSTPNNQRDEVDVPRRERSDMEVESEVENPANEEIQNPIENRPDNQGDGGNIENGFLNYTGGNLSGGLTYYMGIPQNNTIIPLGLDPQETIEINTTDRSDLNNEWYQMMLNEMIRNRRNNH